MSADAFDEERLTASLLARLTLIIPTRNRPQELDRVLRFWSPWPVSIIVVDGSESTHEEREYRLGRAIVVHHCDPEFGSRLSWASRRVETEYACLQPDDDFHLPRAASRAVGWLDEHKSYSAVVGDGQLFTPDFHFSPSSQGRWVTADNPKERLLQHFRNLSWSYVYGIHRTESLSASLQACSSSMATPGFLKDPNLVMFEFGMEACGAVMGKLAQLDDVLLLKAVGNQSKDVRHTDSWSDWMHSASGAMAAEAWRQELSTQISSAIHVDSDVVDAWFVAALELQLRENARVTRGGRTGRRSNMGIPVPSGALKRVSFALRPQHHKSEDQFCSYVARSTRYAHRSAFSALRCAYRLMRKVVGLVRLPVPRNEWDWGDPRDLQDFWEAHERTSKRR